MFNNLLFINSIILFIISSLAAQEKNHICADRWPNASPPYHFTPNKCGPDSPLADLIPNNFGSVNLGNACNNHDRCWMELKDFNQYGRCELRFAEDLTKACAKAEVCIDIGFTKKCIPNPMEIAACESMVAPSYTSATGAGVFFQRLKKARDEQEEFEKCVTQYGYHKRATKKK